LVVAVVAGHQRHGVLRHQVLGGGLGTHRLDALGVGTDEHDAGVLAGAREGRVLREEAVAGMDRLRAALFRGLEVAPPYLPFAPAWRQAGVDLGRLQVVHAGTPRDALWAT